MNKFKKIIASILIVLVFLCSFIPISQASFFTNNLGGGDLEEKSEIEETIDSDDGGIFEKIIAKMIGGIAETILDLTTNKQFGIGFSSYDKLIFAKDSTDISPFTDEQWNDMMQWYKKMTLIAGSLMIIVVVITAYKVIIGGYSIDSRNEAKDSLMRLFFGAASIGFAPLFVKFLLFLNNNLVHILVGYSNGSLEDLLGNGVISNIRTGNAIATAIVIALFAYLFFKLNVKFIIRQFTILIFTLFTPIISIMWMINKRTIGASIWFGQILINVFMQFIYAFLFLIYMNFLPKSGGWATSILWAMMILPIADALQNTLQNLISRVAGVNNDELATRGIGMTGAMAHSIKALAYQFQSPSTQATNATSFLGRMFREEGINQIKEMNATPIEQTPMNATNIVGTPMKSKNMYSTEERTLQKSSFGKAMFSAGREAMNIGMYMAEGKNFGNTTNFNKYSSLIKGKQNNKTKDSTQENDET